MILSILLDSRLSSLSIPTYQRIPLGTWDISEENNAYPNKGCLKAHGLCATPSVVDSQSTSKFCAVTKVTAYFHFSEPASGSLDDIYDIESTCYPHKQHTFMHHGISSLPKTNVFIAFFL